MALVNKNRYNLYAIHIYAVQLRFFCAKSFRNAVLLILDKNSVNPIFDQYLCQLKSCPDIDPRNTLPIWEIREIQ
jgi:hypothetical protein